MIFKMHIGMIFELDMVERKKEKEKKNLLNGGMILALLFMFATTNLNLRIMKMQWLDNNY
jgi:hypothetical protein